MNWREWPKGTENEEKGITLQCPVCSSMLRPVEIWHVETEYTYLGDEINTACFTAICLKCKTWYNRHAPAESVNITPDTETIIDLEDRVQTLEETLSRLITWIRTQQTQPQSMTERPTGAKPHDDTEDFTRKYHYLL